MEHHETQKYPIIYISKPKWMINFECPLCSGKYKTFETTIVHTCTKCNKESRVNPSSYSIDSLNFYLAIAMKKLRNHDKIGLRATDAYALLLIPLVEYLTSVGLRMIKNHKIDDINKKNNKPIVVNEIILEKLGAIKK